MTAMVAVCAILCRRVGVGQPPAATDCSGETSYSVSDSAPLAITVRCRTFEIGAVSISSCGKRLHELRVPMSSPQVPDSQAPRQ